jgi:hypothetical protein
MLLARLLAFVTVALAALPAAAQTAPGAIPAPAPASPVARLLLDTVDQACIPVLSRQVTWPATGKDEDALLARLKLQPGVPNDFIEKLKKVDPTMGSISRAILAGGVAEDGAFALALGGVETSCRMLVYRTADPIALARATETMLIARGWKYVALPPTRTPKRVFVRRVAGDRVAAVHVVMPAIDTPLKPLLVVDVFPPGTPVPPEFGL